MRKFTLFLVTFLLAASAGIAQTHQLTLENDGFRANWFHNGNENSPVIILLGGSEGGLSFGNQWAPWLNDAGYSVLSIAYFGKRKTLQSLYE